MSELVLLGIVSCGLDSVATDHVAVRRPLPEGFEWVAAGVFFVSAFCTALVFWRI